MQTIYSHLQFALQGRGEAFCYRPKKTGGSTDLYPLCGLHSKRLLRECRRKSNRQEKRRQGKGGVVAV